VLHGNFANLSSESKFAYCRDMNGLCLSGRGENEREDRVNGPIEKRLTGWCRSDCLHPAHITTLPNTASMLETRDAAAMDNEVASHNASITSRTEAQSIPKDLPVYVCELCLELKGFHKP
jgi:hypothetical protein